MSKASRQIHSTYRLQLHAGFGFAAASEIVPYLAELGVSHLYLSPILQAAPGSMHGYDVVDHTRVSTELGGHAGFEQLVASAHDVGLGLVVDVVPNHMAIPTPCELNAPLWDTLRHGRSSRYAHWFDVEWDLLDGKIGLAVLGKPLDELIDSGELAIDSTGHGPVIRYQDQRFPIDPDTHGDDVRRVLAQQHYVLADWRDKDRILNYRRFFDVDTLIAVRVELLDVFAATHQVLVDLCRDGAIDGLRVDHPDGLADPEEYLARLHRATHGAWVVVEKILAESEALPTSWMTAGTTGYDAIQAIQTALVPDAGAGLDRLWRQTGWQATLQSTEASAKKYVVDHVLEVEVSRLTRLAVDAARLGGRKLTASQAAQALAELLQRVEVYRAYITIGNAPSPEARDEIARLVARTRAARPDLSDAIGTIEALLLDVHETTPAGQDLLVRFQQVSGPVMAKGIEDTTFYRYHRLIALNEVGGDPSALMHPDVRALHSWAERQSAQWPLGMTTLSTHDTKRAEDVRARLIAAAEDLDGWEQAWRPVSEAARLVDVDAPTAYLVFQTLVGACPISVSRLSDYLQKAVREAKLQTTWQSPKSGYEDRVRALAERCVADGPESSAIASWVEALAPATRAVTLSTKLLQLMLPGVPDVYQGSELVIRTLVDPDNRQPVDYADRASRLHRLAGLRHADSSGLLTLDDEKLLVTATAVRLRGSEDRSLERPYVPLEVTTPHAIGFQRGDIAVVATRWPWRLARDGWQGGIVRLGPGRWTDQFTGNAYAAGDVACEQLLSELPVALLVRSLP